MSKKKVISFKDVCKILETAANGSQIKYQGQDGFWNLSLEDFKNFEFYGIKLIAPINETHYSQLLSHQKDNDVHNEKVAHIKHDSRGANSGLIKGLKGVFPFNGEYLNRLPWGGKQVSSEDIQAIEEWIDYGCNEHSLDLPETKEKSLKAGTAVLKPYRFATNIHKREEKQLKVRKDIDHLSESEEEKLRNAYWELWTLNQFPRDKRSIFSWARLHGDECQHGWEQFLTWHRMYLYSFEQALQDVDPDVTLPWWDYTHERYLGGIPPASLSPTNKHYDPNGVSGIIPKALRCWINEKGIEKLRNTHCVSKTSIAALEKIAGKRYNSAVEFFNAANITEQKEKNSIYPILTETNPLWYQFRYPGMFYKQNSDGTLVKPLQKITIVDFAHYHYPTNSDIKHLYDLNTFRDFGGGPIYDQSFGMIDVEPHNAIHLYTGGMNPNYMPLASNPGNPSLSADPNEPMFGDMFTNLTAAFDFIFWPHHCNVDRIFHEWQQKYPGQFSEDEDFALPGLGFTARDAKSIYRLGYEYSSDAEIWKTEHAPLQGFKTEPVQLSGRFTLNF